MSGTHCRKADAQVAVVRLRFIQANSAVKVILAAGGYTTVNTLGSRFSQPFGVAVDASRWD